VTAPKNIVVGRYRVIGVLGGGGMKQVYLAEDLRLANRQCALAEMIDSFADPKEQQAAVAAFQREADMLAGLKNDHIPQVFDRFSERNRHYLVMEYVAGQTLEQMLGAAGGKLDEATVIDVSIQILEALEYLHGLNPPVIYRDLKPSNVILTAEGRVKVIDFGIARFFQPQATATMIGSSGYAPPEQYKGRVEARTDLYALGATMHYLLTGRDPAAEPPFTFPPVGKLRPDISPRLADIVDEALAYNISERIPHAVDFKRRLIRLKTGSIGTPIGGQTEPVLLDTAASQVQCSRCARWIPADASLCPYCGATFPTRAGFQLGDSTAETARLDGATKPVRRKSRWIYATAGLLILAGIVFGGVYYRQQMRELISGEETAGPAAPEKAERQAATEAPQNPSEKSATPTDAAEKHQVELKEKLDQDIAALQKAKPGGARETQLREDAIATALAMNPGPPPPDSAQQEIERAKSELKVAATPSDYKAAAGTLRKALRQAPWLAEGYQALADAEQQAGNYSAAISSLKYYSLANPQASDATQVQSKIVELQQLQLKAQQADEEQRKVALLKKQQGAAAPSRPQPAALCGSGNEPAPTHVSAGRTFRDCVDCPEMVVVPAGSFCMGSSPSEPERRGDFEGPQHAVTIGHAFAVGRFPVTRDEYERFAAETSRSSNEWQNPSLNQYGHTIVFAQTSRDPVVSVNWDDAKAYVTWLSQKTGHKYRLLSESEYEYAERAGTTTAYWWGDSAGEVCSYANAGDCHHNGTVPVGSYTANALGLYDMAGNAWEWTEDCWHDSYAGAPDDGTAWTTGDCGQRVVRGEAFDDPTGNLRSAYRGIGNAGNRDFAYAQGFRVARTL
jgi:formylglycine-generating enzyme required for sulfatase activity